MNKIIITLLLLYPCTAAAEIQAHATIHGEITSKNRIVIDSIDGQSVNTAGSEYSISPGMHQLKAYLIKTSSNNPEKLIKVNLQWNARPGQAYQVVMEKRSQHMDGRVIDDQGRIVSQYAEQEIVPLIVNGFLDAKV